jgi:hypothetical protein
VVTMGEVGETMRDWRRCNEVMMDE